MSAPLVIVQFSVGKKERVPEWIPERIKEDEGTSELRIQRNAAAPEAQLVVKPAERIDVAGLYIDLQLSGYVPVSVYYQRRLAHQSRRPYYAIRFTFVHESQMTENSVDLSKEDPMLSDTLTDLLTKSLWRVRAYCNPRGDESLVSVNLEVPVDIQEQNLRDSEGEFVLDEAGCKVKVMTPANGSLNVSIDSVDDGQYELSAAVA